MENNVRNAEASLIVKKTHTALFQQNIIFLSQAQFKKAFPFFFSFPHNS